MEMHFSTYGVIVSRARPCPPRRPIRRTLSQLAAKLHSTDLSCAVQTTGGVLLFLKTTFRMAHAMDTARVRMMKNGELVSSVATAYCAPHLGRVNLSLAALGNNGCNVQVHV